MKNFSVIIPIVTYLLTSFIPEQYLVDSPKRTYDDSVIVTDNYIKLMFKIEVMEDLKWYSNDVNVGALEYQWSSNFRLGDISYTAGFSLFKHPGAKQKYGSFEELIKDGQTSVFENLLVGTPGIGQEMVSRISMGSIMKGVKIRSELMGDLLVVTIEDEKILKKFLTYLPQNINFLTKTPSSSFNTFSVQVIYH